MRVPGVGMIVLWSVGVVLLVHQPYEPVRSLALAPQSNAYPDTKPPMNVAYDPAAPSLTCDTSCHSDPKYRREEIHQTEACTTCHMTTAQLQQEASTLSSQQKRLAARPQTPGRRKIEGALVEKQDEARLRLKGKPMVLPPTDLSVPEGMVYIPAGEFIMGTNTRWEDESPEHVVYLDAYFIDRYEVTNAAYQHFVEATGARPPGHWRGGMYPAALADHPVTYVSWYDAVAYCQWAKKRLPSEEEWEKAARGTDGRQYPWGNAFYANRSNNPQQKSKGTEPVGSYEQGKSPYGLYDMSGNVWEWVDAWYKPHAGNDVPSEEYGEKYKVSKGGSWYNCLFYNCSISAPSYNRAFLVPVTKNSSLGFRCVKDVQTNQQ